MDAELQRGIALAVTVAGALWFWGLRRSKELTWERGVFPVTMMALGALYEFRSFLSQAMETLSVWIVVLIFGAS